MTQKERMEQRENELDEICAELKVGDKFRCNRDGVAKVINIFVDEDNILIAYKQKYGKDYNYSLKHLRSVAFAIHLYRQEYEGRFGEGKMKKD